MEAPYSIFAIQIPGLPSTLRHVCQMDAPRAVEVFHHDLAERLISPSSPDKYRVMLFELRPDNYAGYVVDLASDDTKWQHFLVSKAGVCLGRAVEWENFLEMQARNQYGSQNKARRKATPDALAGPSQ